MEWSGLEWVGVEPPREASVWNQKRTTQSLEFDVGESVGVGREERGTGWTTKAYTLSLGRCDGTSFFF